MKAEKSTITIFLLPTFDLYSGVIRVMKIVNFDGYIHIMNLIKNCKYSFVVLNICKHPGLLIREVQFVTMLTDLYVILKAEEEFCEND